MQTRNILASVNIVACVGLLALGIAIGHGMSASTLSTPAAFDAPSPPACNSPAFLQKLQELAKKYRTLESTETGGQGVEGILASVLHIQSTTTLGALGNGFTSCSLIYDHGVPSSKATYNYTIGLDDSGNLIWRSADYPPFYFIMGEPMPFGEQQYP